MIHMYDNDKCPFAACLSRNRTHWHLVRSADDKASTSLYNEEKREELGKVVREAWIKWAKTQPNPKPSWLVPWEGLSEPDKEADRCIADGLIEHLVSCRWFD